MSSEVLRPGLSVGRRARTQLSHLPVAFPIALVLAMLIGLLYLNQASVVATTGYEVRGLETERQHWQIRNEQLKLEIAQLRSLDRVETEARRLGLGPPEQRLFVTRKATAEEWARSPVAQKQQLDRSSVSVDDEQEQATEWWKVLLDYAQNWLTTRFLPKPDPGL